MKCLYSVLVTPRFLYWPFHLMTAATFFLLLIAFLGLLLHSLHFVFILMVLTVKEYHSSAFN